MRNLGILLSVLGLFGLLGCKEDRVVAPSPTLQDLRKPKPPVELNTRGTPGRIHVESANPSLPVAPVPVVSALPKEVVITAQFHDDVVFDDGTSGGSYMLEFSGTAVGLDAQPYLDVSGSLYQGSYQIVEPDLADCYFDYTQDLSISLADDKITWHWTGYSSSDSCGEWGQKVLDGGMRIEVTNYSVPGGSLESLVLEFAP